MNQRTIKLYEEATEFAYVTIGKEHSDKSYFQAAIAGKFAELIVRECLDIVNRHEYSYHEADPLWETAQLIKEHFGVK